MVAPSDETMIPLALSATGGPAGDAFLAWALVGASARPEKATVLFGGDFCPGPMVEDRAAWLAIADAAGQPFFSSLNALAGYSVVNLESPLGRGATPPKAGHRLVSDPGWADVLRRSGVNAVGLANNHTMDQGQGGLAATLSACDDAGLRCFGAGGSAEQACEALIVKTGGRTLSVIALAEHEFGVATRTSAGVCPLSPEDALRRIRSQRALGNDVIVLVHGGNEHHPLPRPGLRETCRFLVDCGAVAVLCAHSHIVGPLEWYAGAPILYGLGNLYFPTPGWDQPAGWAEGLCAILSFGEKEGIEVLLVPTRFDGVSGIAPVTETAARELAARLEAMSRVVADDDMLESEWRRHVESNRRRYLSGLLGLTRLERLALRAGIWPWWRMPRRRTADLLNLIRCESHREALIGLLEDVVDGS